ncbi:Glycosyl transferase family 2 [Mesorhizobium sp. SOD10]|nr:Glycosyl transferase family 2 [Mesorhizobium sp. SOD10]
MNVSSANTSLIICAHTLERWQDLLESVASVRRLEPPPDEIVVVVDHNAELKARAEAQFVDLLVIENRNRRGLSGARNSGIAASRGSLIAFLDDDAIAEPRWLAYMISHCDRPEVLGAMGRIEPLWLGPRPRWFPDEFLWVVGCTYRGHPDKVGPVRSLLGCGMCLRREVFEKVGGFNAALGRTQKSLPMSGEETELCIRARKAIPAGEFIFEPRAVVRHRIPAKRLTQRYFWLRCYAEGLSKAYMSALLHSREALSAERTYVWRVLSRGIVRGFGDAILRADAEGLGRAFAIAAGLACSIGGFIIGKLEIVANLIYLPRRQKSAFRPRIRALTRFR